MENSVAFNNWSYNMSWHRQLASLIETNVFEIHIFVCYFFTIIILFVIIWCKDNKLIFYLYHKTFYLRKMLVDRC